MKIIQVVTQMEAGGAQRVAYLLKQEFDLLGHDSSLWFLYQKRPAYVHLSGVHCLIDHPFSLSDCFRLLPRLAQLIHREKPDLLITHTHYANVLVHILSCILRVRHRVAVQHNPLRSYPSAARAVDYLLGSVGFYSRNVAVSRTVAASAARYPRAYRDRLRVIYNGTPEPAACAPREVTRAQKHIPLDATLLVNVGRLSAQKNQEFLILLLTRDKSLHLLLVGDGELRTSLFALAVQLQVSDRVRFTGEVSPAEVAALISCGDIFVLPSHFEAVGMVMLEAMRLGVPVISNDIPSSREFLGEAGFLVETTSPDKWLSAIETIIGQPALVMEMVTMAKSRAQRFTVPKMADAYEALTAPLDSRGFAASVDGRGFSGTESVR
jgi:glycosyltransferase involved in cell wall biosynthesis